MSSTLNKVMSLLWETKSIMKEHEGTEWTREHGLEFDDDKHRWTCPDGGCKVDTPHSHLVDSEEKPAKEESMGDMLDSYDRQYSIREKISDNLQAAEETDFLSNFTKELNNEDMTDAPSYKPISASAENYLMDEEFYLQVNEFETWGFLMDTQFADEDEVEEHVNLVQSTIKGLYSDMSAVKDSYVVYRGLPEQMKFRSGTMHYIEEGDEFKLDTFTSTTRSPETAIFFTNDRHGYAEEPATTLVEIQLDPTTMALTLSNEDTKQIGLLEHETIISPENEMRIVKILRNVKLGYGVVENYVVAEMVPNWDDSEDGELNKIRKMVNYARLMSKNAPDKKPPMAEKYDLDWDDEKHRWVLPDGDDVDLLDTVKSIFDEAIEMYKKDNYRSAKHLLVNIRMAAYQVNNEHGKRIMQTVDSLIKNVGKKQNNYERRMLRSGKGMSDWGLGSDSWHLGDVVARKFNAEKDTSYQDETMPILARYKRNDYVPMNKRLRTNDDRDDAMGKRIKRIAKLMSPLSTNQVLYRGIKAYDSTEWDNRNVGDVIVAEGFTSASRSPRMAYRFYSHDPQKTVLDNENLGRDIEGVFLEIRNTKGMLGVTTHSQGETIMNHNTSFKIVDIQNDITIGSRKIKRYMRIEFVKDE